MSRPTARTRRAEVSPAEHAAGPGSIAPGAGSFRFVDERGGADRSRSLGVWYHRPRLLAHDTPVVFVMHGVKRDAKHYRDTWETAAERFGFLLLCPELLAQTYPRRAYQLGNLVDEACRPLPEEEWTFHAIERLFDSVKEATGNTSERYSIYGHSAGGQFVHRLAMFLPQARYATAIAANTGWYTMPTFTGKRFPYGLRKSGHSQERLRKAFGRHLVVLLGERDTDAGDPHLRQSTGARRQGGNRLERGRAFYGTASREAEKLGVKLSWELRTVPGAAHFDPQMMPAAARTLSESRIGFARSELPLPTYPG